MGSMDHNTRDQHDNSFHSCASTNSYDLLPSLERSSSISEKVVSFLDSIRILFEKNSSPTRNARCSSCCITTNNETTKTTIPRRMSSGYHSLDASWEIENSYIKISKFSGESLFLYFHFFPFLMFLRFIVTIQSQY